MFILSIQLGGVVILIKKVMLLKGINAYEILPCKLVKKKDEMVPYRSKRSKENHILLDIRMALDPGYSGGRAY